MANKRVNDDGSMKAVIYARYSSENQREESIEGQLRECYAFARKNNISVLAEYIDRAFSAKTDRRPDFQRMIKDSAKKNFNLVLVWKLDRFVRNRYDSANYKATLKRNGVKVMSVTESISDGSEGILLESVLEGMAEYYSAELSEKVLRGHHENALRCRYNGGTLPIGFSIDKEKNYHYYKCSSAKKNKGCHRKPVKKKWIEDAVIDEVRNVLHDDVFIGDVIHKYLEYQQQENTVIPYLEKIKS